MQAAGGETVVAFEGPPYDGSRYAETWRGFYDEWFAAHHFKPLLGWQRTGTGWHGRWAGGDERATVVDVHFNTAGDGQTSGLLMITPEL